MELRHGFKHTDVGVIPEDWRTSKVGDVCGCIVPGRSKPKLFDGDIPWITTPDLENGRPVTTSRLGLCVSEEEAKSIGSKIVPPGSVLMSCAGELGIVAITNNEIVVNQQLHVFIPTDQIEATFLLSALAFRKSHIENVGTKTAVPYLNKNACNSILVPLPSPSEQRAIAEALSDVDGLLDGLHRLIAKKRSLKWAAMQQLLTGQTRLPGFDGEIKLMRLGELCDYVDGIPTSGGDLGYLEIGDVNVETKSYDVGQKEKLSVRGAVKVPVGTLLISTVRPTRGAIVTTRSSLHVSSAFCRVRPVNGLLFHLVCQPVFLAYLGENSMGGTYPTCRDETILEYESLLPTDPAEQTAIAEVLTDMDVELESLEQRREKTRALKQAMMQELLTGKTRLVAPEEAHA